MEQKGVNGSDPYRRDGEAAIALLEQVLARRVWQILTHRWVRVLYELTFGFIAFSVMVVTMIGIQQVDPGDSAASAPMKQILVFFQANMAILLFLEGALLFRLSNNYRRAMLGLGMDPTPNEKDVLKRYMFSARVVAGTGMRRIIYAAMVTICFWETFHARSFVLLVCALVLVLVCRWSVVQRKEFMAIIEKLEAS